MNSLIDSKIKYINTFGNYTVMSYNDEYLRIEFLQDGRVQGVFEAWEELDSFLSGMMLVFFTNKIDKKNNRGL